MKPISDKKRKQLEDAGLPISPFSKVGGNKKQPIKPKSTSRVSEDKLYKLACIQAEMNNIEKYGELTCDFCRQPMYDSVPEHHHVAGRVGKLYTDVRGLWIAHIGCHSIGRNAYHILLLSDQVTKEWFPRLLETIKVVDEAKFRRLLGKAENYGYQHLIKEE